MSYISGYVTGGIIFNLCLDDGINKIFIKPSDVM